MPKAIIFNKWKDIFGKYNVNNPLEKWIQDKRKPCKYTHIHGILTYAKIFGFISSQMYANSNNNEILILFITSF